MFHIVLCRRSAMYLVLQELDDSKPKNLRRAFYYRNTNGTNLTCLMSFFRFCFVCAENWSREEEMLANPKPVAELPNSGMTHMIVRWDVAWLGGDGRVAFVLPQLPSILPSRILGIFGLVDLCILWALWDWLIEIHEAKHGRFSSFSSLGYRTWPDMMIYEYNCCHYHEYIYEKDMIQITNVTVICCKTKMGLYWHCNRAMRLRYDIT